MTLDDALEMVARTDPGRLRARNEDAVFAEPGLGLAILADGMGGYNAGEVASGMATTLLATNFARTIAGGMADSGGAGEVDLAERCIGNEVAIANAAIFNAAQSQPQYAGMGTTLVLAWFHDNRMSVAHIGDSRLYRWRERRLVQLTKDHSLLQEMLDSGMITAEEARFSQNRNLVTRALGVDPDVRAEIHLHDLVVGDIVLLCSDGLSDMVDDEEIALTLDTLGGNLVQAAEQLVRIANENGGRDNISVILVRVRGDYAAPRGWWHKLLARVS